MKRLLLMVLLLAGCVSPEQAARNREAQAYREAQQREAYREAVFSQCDRMGFTRGTDAFANCVLQTHNQNQANRAAIGAALLQGQMANQPRSTECTRGILGSVSCVSR